MTTLFRTNRLRGVGAHIMRVVPLLFSAMLIFTACVEEQITPQENGKTITFSLNVPKNFTPHTYAITENGTTNTGDAYVGTIDVLIFEKSGNKTFYSGPHYGSIGPVSNGAVDVTIRIPEGVSTTTHDIEVFANSRSIINDANPSSAFTGKTKAQVFQLLKLSLSSPYKWNATPGSQGYIPIPMHGPVTGATGSYAAQIVRMLARVDISNTVDAIGNFQLKNVHVFNYNTAGYVAPIDGASPSVPSSVFNSGASSKLSFDTQNNNIYNEEIFLFEAAAGSAADFTNNPCIVIGGTYDGSASNSYYRIDFVETDGTYLPILRNNKYTFTITKIFGPGYDTPEKAFASRPSNVEYTVEKWADSNIVDAAYNGQYMIGTSAAAFNFDSAPKTKDNGDNILFVQTNHPDGWTSEITYTNGSGWLSLITLDGTAATSGSQGTTSVKLKLDPNNGTSSRTATIKLTAGNVVYSVNVTQSHEAKVYDLFQPEAASYTMFTAPTYVDKIFIPVSHANSGSTIKLNSSDSYTVEIDPSSTSGAINKAEAFGIGSGGHIYLEAGTATGTAKINLKKGTETIHTWDIDVKAIALNAATVSAAYPMDGSDTYSVTINAAEDYSRKFTVYISHDDDGSAATSIPSSVVMSGKTGTFNITSKDRRSINPADPRPQKTVTLSFGSSASATDLGTATLNFITPEYESNSYIVKQGQSIYIPVSQVNKSSENNKVELSSESFTAGLVWMVKDDGNDPGAIGSSSVIKTITPVGSGSGGYIFVERGTAQGNAVIGIRKNGSDDLIWSWHIWATDAAPVAPGGGNGFMDRNLGAFANTAGNTPQSIGLLYQWGRKDPFPGSKTYTPASGEGTGGTEPIIRCGDFATVSSKRNTFDAYDPATMNLPGQLSITASVQQPDRFITSSGGDWSSEMNESNSNRWAASGNKSVYDPCPAGWRVPRNGVWGFTNNEASWSAHDGYSRTNSNYGGVYAAAGRRDGSNGQFINVGASGYFWLASPYDAYYCYRLFFDSSSVHPSNVYGLRSHGYSVRCLQE